MRKEEKRPIGEKEIELPGWMSKAILVAMLLFIVIAIGFIAYGNYVQSSVGVNKSNERYNRVIRWSGLSEYSVQRGNMNIRITENMTIDEVRDLYFSYEGYARPMAQAMLDYVCDGGDDRFIMNAAGLNR